MPKPITGLTAKQVDSMRRDASGVVARFDTNNDGKISREEAKAKKRIDTYSTDYTTRISDDYVNRTTIINDRMATMKDDAFASDVDGDGFLSPEDMVQSEMERADTNGDGKISGWEKFKMNFGGMRDRYERHYDVEVNRRSRLEYNPLPREEQRPVPPSSDYRPTPPGGYDDRPTPPGGYNDRPTPPGGSSSRPTPPGGSSSRPTPPGSSSDSRPTPPGGSSSSGSSSRPTPPGGSSSRPTPPGA